MEKETEQKYKTLFTLAVMSGAREGEILALKWTDIDWFNVRCTSGEHSTTGVFLSPGAMLHGALST